MPLSTLATRGVAVLCTTVLIAGALAACGSDSPTDTRSDSPTSVASVAAAASGLVLDDGWVKAVDVQPAGGGTSSMAPMSAMFGALRNTTDADITVTGGSSPVAGRVELHETVRNDSGQMQMQPKESGFVIPAGGRHVLQPGGDHVMLMQLRESLANGTSTTVTLTTSAGDITVTAPVRQFPGAAESYVPTPSAS